MTANKSQPQEIITDSVTRSLLAASDNPAMIINRAGRILAANHAACIMLNTNDTSEIEGHLLADFIPEDLFIARRNRLRAALQNDKTSHMEEEINGHAYVHSFSGIPDEDGTMTRVAVISQDVTALRRTGENLRREQQRQIFFMETLPGLVYHIYPDNTVRYANRYFRKLFGSPKGKDCHELLGCTESLCPACPPRAAMEGDKNIEREWTLDDKRTFHLQFSPMTDKAGERMVMVLGIDISERKLAEDKLRQARDELEDRVHERTKKLQELNRKLTDKSLHLIEAKKKAVSAAKAKSSFLANMSHEIRTPLNAILGMTELALRTEDQEQNAVYLNHVLEAGDSLLTLINDILDFSKIEAGKMVLGTEPFRLSTIIDSVMRIHRIQAEDKELEITQDVASNVPDVLLGDPQRLRQILINLMGNAVKFTSEGSIALSVRTEQSAQKEDDRSVLLRFSVRDTGVGIPRSRQKDIFSDFMQADASITRRFGGSGLGLTICSQLVRLMDGTISVTSTEGKGSTFTFTVRLQRSHPDELIDNGNAENVPSPDIPHLNILLADDNALNRKLAATVLQEQGHDVTQVENGYEAVELLKAGHFDMVLMDVQMPIMDGITATRVIRDPNSGVLNPSIPIIALTAHALKGDRERFLSVGMNAYLAKPIRITRLIETIGRAYFAKGKGPLRTGEEQDQKHGRQDESLPVTPHPFDRDMALERLGGREDLLRNMDKIFLRDTPGEIFLVREGIQENDLEKARNSAHSIKGTARTIGAVRAGALAEQMEFLCKQGDVDAARREIDELEKAVTAALDHVAESTSTVTSEKNHDQNHSGS